MATDGCIPLKGPLANLAAKIGGKLVRNKDGVLVLQKAGADEAVFPSERDAYNHITRLIRIASLNAETHAKINDLIEKGVPLPIDNFEDMVKFHDELAISHDVMGGGEQPGRVGALAGKLGYYITRQQSWMMRQGEGGRYIANGIHRFNVAREQIELGGETRLRPAAAILKRITTPAELKSKTAPQEAQQLWNKIVKPYMDSVREMSDFLGIGEDLVPADGIPTWYGVTANDISPKVVKAAQQKGILAPNEGAKELAERFNHPDFGPRPANVSGRDWIAAKRWLRDKGTAFAGEANHMRSGEGFMNDIEATLVGWNRAVSRRIAEAAVFGPNLERIHQAIDTMGDGAFARHIPLVETVTRDMLGKVYLPRSNAERTMTDIARFSLASSASRHIAQNKIAIMQHGFLDLHGRGIVGALGRQLFHMKGTAEEINRMGVFMRQANYEVGEHPGDLMLDVSKETHDKVLPWLKSVGVPEAAKVTAKASTLGIHVMVNTDRLLATVAARNLFDDYLDRAIKGNRNKLAHFADILGLGDPTTERGRAAMVDHLRTMDRGQLKQYYVKRMADTAGTTYHPGDLPGLARARVGELDLGRWLTMFRGFRWNVAHNIWNQMFSPNYSLPYRLRVFGRFATATGFLSPIDAVMRHAKVAGALGVGAAAFGVGVSNIDSETAYKATEKALHDPSTSSILYASFMLAVNDGTLGIGADMVQGFNLANPQIFERSIISGNIPIIDKVSNLSIAASLAINGSLTDDEKEKDRAYKEFLEDLPLGDALARASGVRETPKVPKTQVIKEMLKKGAGAAGLR